MTTAQVEAKQAVVTLDLTDTISEHIVAKRKQYIANNTLNDATETVETTKEILEAGLTLAENLGDTDLCSSINEAISYSGEEDGVDA